MTASKPAAPAKYQKWWGWGADGDKPYAVADKPKFPPFAMERLGVDILAKDLEEPQLADIDVPASILGEELKAQLVGTVGEANVRTDDEMRVVHAYGKGVRDLVRVRRGILGRVPDVVVYPGSSAEVEAVMEACLRADAVLIPYGGGSNIVAALEAEPGEQRVVVTVDMGRMNKVLQIDETAEIALIQAGALGPDMEEQLNAKGWTLGHFPDSFMWSTVGGWIATRSTGSQSDKYGDIADITRGLEMVMPAEPGSERRTQVLSLRPLPSYSSGPSVREMVLGSEGRLGIITQAWMQVHRIAEAREIQAYFYPTYDAGLKAAELIAHSDAKPMMLRVSDAAETQFSMANGKKSSKKSHYINKAMQKVMEAKGWNLEEICISFVGFEGSPVHVRYAKSVVNKIVRAQGGMNVGKGPGTLFDQKKYDIPYIRDFLLNMGIPADVSETSTPWSRTKEIHDETVKAAEKAFAETGHKGFIMCHISHSYHAGACQYFTFAVADGSENNMATYDHVKRAVQQSFMDHGGTVSHHHGVGEEHSPWMEQDISPAGVHIQRKLFEGVDPGKNLNPGKIVHDGRPGISTNSDDA
ncbi:MULTISPECIES: FAD-binding oxidoreductase [unclassified Luteococcus]|uniref:FAD-binding oxidoreductase n=1 Tax=unclassified Luteococcus TaxID=2639923 RepID=UPI00313CD602